MATVSLAGLRAIEALATHGSMTAAAGELGYTPSAISQQIARLERDLHQTLIERQGRRVALTIAGPLANCHEAFPGDAAGTHTQRLAALLAERVLDGSNVVLDVHGGGSWNIKLLHLPLSGR